MTRLAIIFSMLFFTPAWAENKKLTGKTCPDLGLVAEAVMTLRQGGVPLSVVMEEAGKSKRFKDMAILAYEETQWPTEKTRADAVKRFRNSVELDCYKRTLKK